MSEITILEASMLVVGLAQLSTYGIGQESDDVKYGCFITSDDNNFVTSDGLSFNVKV